MSKKKKILGSVSILFLIIFSNFLVYEFAYLKGLSQGSKHGQIYGQITLLQEIYNEFNVQMSDEYSYKNLKKFKQIKYVNVFSYEHDGKKRLIIDSAMF